MSEAGRKVIYLHFTRMLANEAGTRLGEDPEALHDMRVATRRMRAAFALFGAHFDKKTLKLFGKGLRRAGRTLGAVRDLDVLLDKARAHVVALPPEQAGSLDPLLAHWETARDVRAPADARLPRRFGLSRVRGRFRRVPDHARRGRAVDPRG